MVKKIFLLLFIGFLTLNNAQETDLLSIPNPVEFDGTEFFLANAKQRSKTLFQQQYLPKDEDFENFTQVLDFSYFNKEIDIELAVRQQVEMVQQRQKEDKFAKVNVSESPDGKEFIVDYYISSPPEKSDSYLEYNIFRFKNIENGTQKSFLILNYAKRIPGDLKLASKVLTKQRDHLMTAMIEFKIPQLKIVNQGNSEIKK